LAVLSGYLPAKERSLIREYLGIHVLETLINTTKVQRAKRRALWRFLTSGEAEPTTAKSWAILTDPPRLAGRLVVHHEAAHRVRQEIP